MQASMLDHDPLSDSALNETPPNSPEESADSPEESADRFGIRLSLLIASMGLFMAAVWAVSGPSFGKCSALEDLTERHACYDNLRNEQSKPPAKGATSPLMSASGPDSRAYPMEKWN
jgi:hypothetical protein